MNMPGYIPFWYLLGINIVVWEPYPHFKIRSWYLLNVESILFKTPFAINIFLYVNN